MRLQTLVFTVVLAFSSAAISFAQSSIPLNLKADGKTEYSVRLTNGDILTGTISSIIKRTKGSKEPEDGIILQTRMGDLTMYESEIAEIVRRSKLYRHNHRLYIMPTAEPIGTNHFVGLWELLALYGGVGIGDVVSITAGRTVIPTVAASEQGSVVNIKATMYSVELDDAGNRGTFALGGNLTWANAANQIWNLYGAATFTGSRSSITALVFAKIGEPSVYHVTARDWVNSLFRYDSGSIGIGVGLDTRFSDRSDLHFIGELWNANIAKLSNTAVLLGLRLANTSVSADFGIVVVAAQPAFFPVVSFAWTPF